MPIVITQEPRAERQLAPSGTRQAVCYNVWDLGYQKNEWKGESKIRPTLMIGWEINSVIPNGDFAGKRFVLTKRYTKSLFPKGNLYKDLVAWLGRPLTVEEQRSFDVEHMIGKNCLLNIIHSTRADGSGMNAKVENVIQCPSEMPLINSENGRTTPKWVLEIMNKAIPPEDARIELERMPF